MHTVESLICAALRAECPAWPSSTDAPLLSEFLRRGDYHGVLPLLHHLLDASRARAMGWPQELLENCRQRAIAQTMRELQHRQLLKKALPALSEIRAQPVLFKGTALAYGLYPNPALRTRADTDLIVPRQRREAVTESLEQLGFVRGRGISGNFVSNETSFTKTGSDGDGHTLDLHWRISNSQVLAKLVTYEELLAQARPLANLDPRALAAGPVHALLLACMHRATHKQAPYYVDGVAYYSADRLIWFYDIHLLAEKFSSSEWSAFMKLAEAKGLRAVCLEGLQGARSRFASRIPEEVIFALSRAGPSEPAAEYLASVGLRQQWLDFKAVDGYASKLGYLAELVFPTPRYMRDKYPDAKPNWLPLLYVRRALTGALKRTKARTA